jgi:hypothetical protein
VTRIKQDGDSNFTRGLIPERLTTQRNTAGRYAQPLGPTLKAECEDWATLHAGTNTQRKANADHFYVLFITVFFCTKEFSFNLILRCAICHAHEYLTGDVKLQAIAYHSSQSVNSQVSCADSKMSAVPQYQAGREEPSDSPGALRLMPAAGRQSDRYQFRPCH